VTALLAAAPATSAGASDRRGVVAVLAAAASWGSWSLFLRPTELPGTVTSPLLLFGVFVLSMPLLRLERRQPTWTRGTLAMLVLYAVLNATNVAAFFSAMSTTSVAVAVLTHSVAPVLVAVLAPFIEGTKSPRAIPAAVLALAGLTLVLEPWRPEARSGDVVLGAGLGLLSAMAYASAVFVLSRLVIRIGGVRAMGYHSLLACLFLLPFAGVSGLAQVDLLDVAILSAAAVLPGMLAGLAFVHGLTAIGAARTAVLSLFEPVVACCIGWLVFGERLGVLAIVGGVMVLGAGALVSGDRTRVRSAA
jgi:DME family drug/metabolite transporter